MSRGHRKEWAQLQRRASLSLSGSSFLSLAGFTIYSPPQRLLFVIGLCWLQLHSVPLTMSSPFPSASQAPSVDAVLPPSPRASIEEGRSKPSPPLHAASFSEVLICGVSGPGQPSANAAVSHGRESDPSPTQPVSMHSLCLLGKPWGDPIPLAIDVKNSKGLGVH